MRSVRSYFLLIPLVMSITVIIFWYSGYMATERYREISEHIIEDDLQYVGELSDLAYSVAAINAELTSLLKLEHNDPGRFYLPAQRQLDLISELIEHLEQQNEAVMDLAHQVDASTASRDAWMIKQGETGSLTTLVPYLKKYLFEMMDAIEVIHLETGRADQYIQSAQDAYSSYHRQISLITSKVQAEVRDEYEEGIQNANLYYWWSAVISLLLVFALFLQVLISSRKFAFNLSSIYDALRNLAEGKTDVEVSHQFKEKELVEMAASLEVFKSTQQALNQALAELSELRDELEKRVELRTDQLAKEVSAHQLSLAKLALSAEVIRTTSEGVVITDAQNRIVDVNDAYSEIMGFSREEVVGKTPAVTKSGRHEKAFYQQMWERLLKERSWHGEVWDRRKNGEVFPKWLSINAVLNDKGEVSHYVGVFSDISELKNKEEQLEWMAHYDPLTQLPNRLLFKDRVNDKIIRAQRENTKVALIFIDLDRFKHINDSLGHAAGDELLMMQSHRLKSMLRVGDAVSQRKGRENFTLARVGGDEFVVSVGELVSVASLADMIRRIQHQIRQPMIVQGMEISIDSSVGVAVYPDDGLDYDELYRNADTAMYKAKANGRGQFALFTEQMNQQAHKRLEMEIDLRHALKKQEFELYYQPKISGTEGSVTGMEALIRWNHPRLGFVPPVEFIHIAEDSGLIISLGEWVLNQACSYCAAINKKAEQPLVVAVNISAKQFLDAELIDKIERALAAARLQPGCLELEITETVVIDDIDEAIEIISNIRAMGVQIALDDFGTGYSSLSYLKRLPIDTLKIDRSFISQLTDPKASDDRAIVSTIISMGHLMKMKIVAEGVETAAHDQHLHELDCDQMQGFYYSKPISGSDFEDYLQQSYEGSGLFQSSAED